MSKRRYINTKFWSDDYILELDPIEKLLFMYFLTNEKTTIAGVYELPLKYVSWETGIDKEMVLKILDRFAFDGKIHYIDGWVYVKNFTKHQNLNNKKIKAGVEAVLSDIPENIKKEIKSLDESYMSHTSVSNYSDTDSDSNSDIDLDSKRGEETSLIPKEKNARDFIRFFHNATEKIRGIEPIIDGGKDGKMILRRLEKVDGDMDRLERMAIWYLTRKKSVKTDSGWTEKYAHPPSISTMLSTSYFNELLSNEANARNYMKDNLDWVSVVYSKTYSPDEDIGDMVKSLSASLSLST